MGIMQLSQGILSGGPVYILFVFWFEVLFIVASDSSSTVFN